MAYIKQVLKIPGDLTRILVEGKYRAQITEMIQTAPYLRGHIESIPDTAYPKTSVRGSGADAGGLSAFEQYEELVPKLLPEYLLQIMASQNPGYIADFIAQNSTFHYQDKQQVLEQRNPLKRLELVCRLLTREIEILKLEGELQEQTQASITKNQHGLLSARADARHPHRTGGRGRRGRDRPVPARRSTSCIWHRRSRKSCRKRSAACPNSRRAPRRLRSSVDTWMSALELPWNVQTRERAWWLPPGAF